MSWLQAHIVVSKEHTALVDLLLENLGALSVTMTDAADEAMLEPPPGAMPLWQATQVTGLFDAGQVNADELRSLIDQALQGIGSPPMRLEALQDRAWERVWLERFQPMRFGQRLWICPTGHRVEAPEAVIVKLDPGLAFGTGTHPTTALCLQWLDQASIEDLSVIDFGCGSGVLGIAAALLGAATVSSVDHDPQAVIATKDNALINAVDERVTAWHSNAFKAQPADIVVANILANILVAMSHEISELVKPGGHLVLSGILDDQVDAVAAAYSPGFDLHATIQDGWVRMNGEKHRE